MKKPFFNCDATVWNMDLWPLWLCYLWVCVAPFLSLYRVGPLPSFYLETGSLLGAVMLVLFTAVEGRLKTKIPTVSVVLLVLAAFWWLQARVMGLVFPGMNDMVVWTFIILALASWACRSWIAEVGQNKVAAVFAWAVCTGALMQAVVVWLQFTGVAGQEWLHGLVAFSGKSSVEGQLGQRNHLGHYLMWGVLSASYLWTQRRVPNWLGVLLVLVLAATLGLVNSRSIFTYVMGVAILLPIWRLRGGRSANRVVVVMLFTLIMVATVQFSIGHVLSWFSDTHYDTALARVGSSGFTMSARDFEWRKAWLAFQTAPWFGHGWGGYALQSFLINVYPDGYNNNLLSVLFTHAHNIVLQLLSEMGLVGTVLVFAGFVMALWRMFRRPLSDASLLMLAMMTVSMCHSMLEYPLWYIYFLTPFVLMAALSPADEKDKVATIRAGKWQNYSLLVASVFLAVGLARLSMVYTDLIDFSVENSKDSEQEVHRKIAGLQRIVNTEPLLRYYAELSLVRKADAAGSSVYPWAEQAAEEALVYRPYANAYQVALYRYRAGRREEAYYWMNKMHAYYPHMMPFYMKKVSGNSQLKDLYGRIKTQCEAFKKINKWAKPCE